MSARQVKHGKAPILYFTRNQSKQEKAIHQVNEDFSDLENKFASINSAIYTTYSFQDDLELRNDDGLVNMNDFMELHNERVIIFHNKVFLHLGLVCQSIHSCVRLSVANG